MSMIINIVIISQWAQWQRKQLLITQIANFNDPIDHSQQSRDGIHPHYVLISHPSDISF